MTTPRHLLVAVNPSASFGARSGAGAQATAALEAAGHRVTAVQERSMAALLERCREHLGAGGVDALVVVGGDGMVHAAVGLLARSEVPLGVVPSGTGNDFARGLGIPQGDPAAAAAVLLEALGREPRTIDLGLVRHGDGQERWFAGVLSAGFDAIVNERANALRWPKGRSRYTRAILHELLRLRPRRYRLVVDGRPRSVEALLVAVANNTSLGGGMLITPKALLDDGLLDLFIVAPMSRLAFLRIFPRVFSGTHVGDRRVGIERVQRVVLETEVVGYADGERIGAPPLDVRVEPAALRLLAPPVSDPAPNGR
jgi:diacylglycerol kinase (ATP)